MSAELSCNGGLLCRPDRNVPAPLCVGRRTVQFGVAANPTSQRTARQIGEAIPWDSPPHHLLRKRDAANDTAYRSRPDAMDITAPGSPSR
jgi:hypothetical protein